MLVALQAVTQGVSSSLPALEHGPSLWHYPAILLDFLNTVLLFMVFALFPNGRFVPKWTRWLALVWIALNVLSYADTPFTQASWFPVFSFASFIIFMGILVLVQIYRYRSVSTAVERQQTKWIVFAFATIILSELVFLVPLLFSPALAQPGSLYNLIISNVSILVLLLGPFSLYLAITRYRLYDIDVLITYAATGAAPASLETTGEPRFNRVWTLLGTPCVNVPTLMAEGNLPVGVQVIAPFGGDGKALAAARFVEQALKR